jgi:hypothetical protein
MSILNKVYSGNYIVYQRGTADNIFLLGHYIYINGDSVISAQSIGPWGPQSKELMYFIPPDDGRINYKSDFYATMHEQTLNTLVGKFNKYYVNANDYYFYDSTYIVPNVGIVRRVTDTKNTRLYPTETKHIINLIRYSVKP